MYCVRSITDDLTWVGANDRRLAMFEGVYSVPRGVSYNAYLLRDAQTVLFDTVDKAVGPHFFENLAYALGGRQLDFVIVQHVEPDHSATLTELMLRHPETAVVCSAKAAALIGQFFGSVADGRIRTVREGDVLETGRHRLRFLAAPMVHWPEVTLTYDETDHILFSADAFGTFGALNGAIFADEVDFYGSYLAEARRYYTNIVGKYGAQVQSLLAKAQKLEIGMICPLHGFVHRKDFGVFLEKYAAWSSYMPEERGVLIAYASIYGHTENAAEIVAARLCERGVPTEMFDVSVTPASEIVSAAFRMSHLLFAAPTYNAGIFVTMEALLHDIVAHNLQNRTVAFIENGSWAAASGRLMRALIEPLKNTTVLDAGVSLRSALREDQSAALDALATALAESVLAPPAALR